MESTDFAPQLTDPSSVTNVTVVNNPAPVVQVQDETIDHTEKPYDAWYWLKDSAGHPSITVTMMAISFWLTTFVYIASIFQKIGPIEIREFNVGASSAYFGLILATYFGRKWTDAKYGNPNIPGGN